MTVLYFQENPCYTKNERTRPFWTPNQHSKCLIGFFKDIKISGMCQWNQLVLKCNLNFIQRNVFPEHEPSVHYILFRNFMANCSSEIFVKRIEKLRLSEMFEFFNKGFSEI